MRGGANTPWKLTLSRNASAEVRWRQVCDNFALAPTDGLG